MTDETLHIVRYGKTVSLCGVTGLSDADHILNDLPSFDVCSDCRKLDREENVVKLSYEFSEIIRQELTEDQLTAVNETNDLTDPYTCHTHDYIDANESMLLAMSNLDIEFDPADENQAELTNEAWNMSKQNFFSPEGTKNIHVDIVESATDRESDLTFSAVTMDEAITALRNLGFNLSRNGSPIGEDKSGATLSVHISNGPHQLEEENVYALWTAFEGSEASSIL